MKVLVTGASGQLGQCLEDVVRSNANSTLEFVFKSAAELDITNSKRVAQEFKQNQYGYCINCAAFTAVDKAEADNESAELVNVIGVTNLAQACKENDTILLHISTDFVFDGSTVQPYSEEDKTGPLGEYGSSKLRGEDEIRKLLSEYYIIRTSWLYSEYGNNFMKTMLRLSSQREEIAVVNDQIGTPTYAKDLANFLLMLIFSRSKAYGTYHFSNLAETSWFGFAQEIFRLAKIDTKIKPIGTEAYPTPAKRPMYSVLDKTKVKKTFGIKIPLWSESLNEALKNYYALLNRKKSK